jgi:hypothetical protein
MSSWSCRQAGGAEKGLLSLESSDKRAQDFNGTAKTTKPSGWGKLETSGMIEEHLRRTLKSLRYGVRVRQLFVSGK